jgi:hypothetical protein
MLIRETELRTYLTDKINVTSKQSQTTHELKNCSKACSSRYLIKAVKES